MTVGGRFPAPRPPEGLSGPPGALPLLGSTLADQQEAAFRRAGLELAEARAGEARLLVREDVFARPEALLALARAGAAAGRDLAWGLDGEAGRLAGALELGREEGPLLVWLAPGGEPTPARLAAAERARLPSMERALPVPLAVEGASLPITDRLVLPTGHWCQTLWANLLGLGPFLWQEILGRNPLLALLRLGLAAARARSLAPERLLSRLVRSGPRCRVHPSAVVEASRLGAGVQIGAGAVVRASVLGDGVVVEDQALVEGCSLGPGARVQRQAMVKYSVLAAGSAFAGTMQLGVLDREAQVKHGAVLMDMAWGRSVTVDVGGRRVEAPLGLLGVCVGAGTVLGAGVQVAPGRVLPPALTVVQGGGALLRSTAVEAAGLFEVREGRLARR